MSAESICPICGKHLKDEAEKETSVIKDHIGEEHPDYEVRKDGIFKKPKPAPAPVID